MKIIVRIKGGPGSGNHGHRGIPGSVGGSAPNYASIIDSAIAFKTAGKAKIYADSVLSQHMESISEEQKRAMIMYSGVKFRDVNHALRHGSSGEERLVSTLDSIIQNDATSIKDPIIVYRGFPPNIVKGKAIGDTLTDNAFVSTTLSPSVAKKFGTVATIIIKPGTRGMAMYRVSKYPEEMEILLNRGTKFTIIQTKPKLILYAEASE